MEGAASTSRNGWAVSAAQKAEFDNLFETLQGAGSGKVSGGTVAPELRKQGPNLTEVGLFRCMIVMGCGLFLPRSLTRTRTLSPSHYAHTHPNIAA